jgi:hypothetical protein
MAKNKNEDSEQEPSKASVDLRLEAFRAHNAAAQFGIKSAMLLNAGAIGLFLTYVQQRKIRIPEVGWVGFLVFILGTIVALMACKVHADDMADFYIASDAERNSMMKHNKWRFGFAILASYISFAVGAFAAAWMLIP